MSLDWLAGLNRHVSDGTRSSQTYKKSRWLLEKFIFPYLGDRPIGSITTSELLQVLKKVDSTGKLETARRAKQKCGQVFRPATGPGFAQRDITVDMRGLLEPPIVEHHAALTDPREVGDLLHAIDRYTGRPITRCALKLAPLLFLRPGELRQAEWPHIDLVEL